MMTIIEYPDFDISGNKHKKTILLLHGAGITRKMWIPQMTSLSTSYQIIAPDLPSHGSKSEIRFTFDSAAIYLKDILEYSNCKQALVVGFSLGGYLASEFANKYPDKTCGLVLVGASTIPKGYASMPYHLMAFLYRFLSPEWLAKREARQWRSKYQDEIAEPVIRAGFYHKVVPILEKEIGGRDFLAPLQEYSKPVLIINGERDHIFRKDERSYRNKIKDSRLVVIDNAGHMCNIDAPTEFNNTLLKFAESIKW